MDADDDWTPEALRALNDPPITDDFPVKLVENLIPENARILDLGCLIGKWIPLWIGKYRIEGLDQCEKAIEMARERYPDIPFYLCKAQDMEFHEEFDLIYTVAVLQHNKHSQKDSIMEKIYEALKVEGYFLMTETTLTHKNAGFLFEDRKVPDNWTDGYSFTKSRWIEYIEEFGFKLVKYVPPWPWYLFKKV